MVFLATLLVTSGWRLQPGGGARLVVPWPTVSPLRGAVCVACGFQQEEVKQVDSWETAPTTATIMGNSCGKQRVLQSFARCFSNLGTPI